MEDAAGPEISDLRSSNFLWRVLTELDMWLMVSTMLRMVSCFANILLTLDRMAVAACAVRGVVDASLIIMLGNKKWKKWSDWIPIDQKTTKISKKHTQMKPLVCFW
jgi:hypothetical protein